MGCFLRDFNPLYFFKRSPFGSNLPHLQTLDVGDNPLENLSEKVMRLLLVKPETLYLSLLQVINTQKRTEPHPHLQLTC